MSVPAYCLNLAVSAVCPSALLGHALILALQRLAGWLVSNTGSIRTLDQPRPHKRRFGEQTPPPLGKIYQIHMHWHTPCLSTAWKRVRASNPKSSERGGAVSDVSSEASVAHRENAAEPNGTSQHRVSVKVVVQCMWAERTWCMEISSRKVCR